MMRREFLQNFKVGDQPLPKEIIDAIMEEHGKGIERERAKYSDYDHLKEQLEARGRSPGLKYDSQINCFISKVAVGLK